MDDLLDVFLNLFEVLFRLALLPFQLFFGLIGLIGGAIAVVINTAGCLVYMAVIGFILIVFLLVI
ncbi:MAG: hypothetical protein CL609_23440 [Anaerolineaceae bacterium]|nr:hypothetical protein [Anaerolineaceae bacterium]